LRIPNAATAAGDVDCLRCCCCRLQLLLLRCGGGGCHSCLIVMGGMILCIECVTDEAPVTVMSKQNVSGSGIVLFCDSHSFASGDGADIND